MAMSSSAEAELMSGAGSPRSHTAEMRRARKAHNKKQARKRHQERRRDRQQQEVERVAQIGEQRDPDNAAKVNHDGVSSQLHEQRTMELEPLPPTREEMPLTTAAVVPSTGKDQDCSNRKEAVEAAKATAIDSVTAKEEGLAVTKKHMGVSGDSLELSSATVEQFQDEEASAMLEVQPVANSNNGIGDTTAESRPDGHDATCAGPVDQYGRLIFTKTDNDEYDREAMEATVWARQVEAAQTAGGNGPSFFKSTVSSGCPQLRPHLATQAAYGGVKRLPIMDRVAQFAVACGLGAGVAPQLLPIMTTTVYGEDYARTVTVMPADVVEHMIDVFWRHHVAPFSVEEVLSRLAATFYGNWGMGEVRHVSVHDGACTWGRDTGVLLLLSRIGTRFISGPVLHPHL